MEFSQAFLKETIQQLAKEENLSKNRIWHVVKNISKKYGYATVPNHIELLQACNEKEREKLEEHLKVKPVRNTSGVAIITVAVKPMGCVSNCIFCPSASGVPKSYTGFEPAIQRAVRKRFDPVEQIKDRLVQYKLMGHISDFGSKIDVIILGGTFLAAQKEYKEEFIKGIYDGLNGFISENMVQAEKINETAANRCIGLTIETRPEYCREKHVDEMLSFGGTRVEIGVQSTYEDVVKFAERNHTVQDSILATRIARDAGFKIVYHMMPGLPLSDFDRDLDMFRQIFIDPSFMPDDLKIYPTMVMPGTKLERIWKEGKYDPITDEETLKMLVEIKKLVPPFVRIRRILRDFSAPMVSSGPKKSNIRELALDELKKHGLRCRCTRCREPQHAKKIYGLNVDFDSIRLVRRDYNAGEGKEIFLSFEDTKNDILIALLRLRIPSEKIHRTEMTDSGIVRELHTYGTHIPVNSPSNEFQHKGYGKNLLAEATRISKEEFDKKKVIVIAGAGVKEYFLKQGFAYDGPYVSKSLN
jgi:elongator complex protein 3